LEAIPFGIPKNQRQSLLEGLDQLGFILRSEAEILDFEANDAAAPPWAYS
jgi:hypothetical protein